MILRCRPRSICSWSYDLTDGAAAQWHASTTVDWISEQGSITVDGETFVVQKHGPLSGHWTLQRGEAVHAEARKPSAFTRTFELTSPTGPLVLEAAAVMRREFLLRSPNDLVANVTPDHAFTRRATIELHRADVDRPTLCFAFWLAVLAWRRAAQSNS